MAGLKLKEGARQPGAEIKRKEPVPGKGKPLRSRVPVSFSRNSIASKEKESLYMELSIMLSAGIDIKSALEIVAEQYKKGVVATKIEFIKGTVIQGASLSEATALAGGFSVYESHSIMIGEETGRLALVLNSLAEHYHKRIKLKRQLTQAMAYPAIVLFTAFGAVAFMLHFIVPMFSDVFKRFGGELPALTVIIIQAAAFFSSYALVLLFCAVLAGVALFSCRNMLWFRVATSKLVLATPVFGEIMRVVLLAQMCEALALLLGARVPLVRAVSLVRSMIRFYAVESSLLQVEKDITEGHSLCGSLSKFPVYDARLLALIKVGEESNRLDFFFEKMAKYYADDAEHKSSVLGALLEPIIIIFLGIVVGGVLMALYLPLFELSNNF